jgi:uncharacterized protein YcaQ
MPMKISLKTVRRAALNSQLLDGRLELPRGKEGVARTIEHLGYVQIDTISVVERAHHHTLWSRRPDYSPLMLDELQAKDRRIFEYWGHAASYLPMKDYRFYLPKMRNISGSHSWFSQVLEKHGHLMEPMLKRIREEGPLGSKDFKAPPGKKRGSWWDWKPAKLALEMLFWRGDLMVTRRDKFQRIYDLTERVLPEGTDTTLPGKEELGSFFIKRALGSLGIAREKEIFEYIHGTGKKTMSEALGGLVDAKEVVPLEIDQLEGRTYFALTRNVEEFESLKGKRRLLHILSPFDNHVIQRVRTKELYGFDYVLECYLPEKKRRYGYFCLPLLWGDRFVGRLDSKADRKKRVLIIKKLTFEPEFDDFDSHLLPLSRKLRELARFNGCERIRVEKTAPAKIKRALKKFIEK